MAKGIRPGRQFWIRSAAVVLVILLGVWMFFIGKQHFILIDNKSAGDMKALKNVTVRIDKQDGIEMVPRQRDQVEVTAQSHKVSVTWTDSSWEEHTLERKIKLPLGEYYMLLSVPYLVNNPESPQEEWLTHFESRAVQQEESAEEEVVTDEFGGISGF